MYPNTAEATCLQSWIAPPVARTVCRAVKTFCLGSSTQLGGDCIVHALLASAVLREEEGIDAHLIAGYAAWRIGRHAAAVVAHHPGGEICATEHGVLLHAWVQAGSHILDPTTYQLPMKMDMIDATDGQKTPISVPKDWEADGLLAHSRERASWAQVRDGRRAGSFCYEPSEALTAQVLSHVDSQLDPDAIAMARQLYRTLKSGQGVRFLAPGGLIEMRP